MIVNTALAEKFSDDIGRGFFLLQTFSFIIQTDSFAFNVVCQLSKAYPRIVHQQEYFVLFSANYIDFSAEKKLQAIPRYEPTVLEII